MTNEPAVQTAKRRGGIDLDRAKLLRVRIQKRLSRSQLAARMSADPDVFKITLDAIAKIEKGQRQPRIGTFSMLCDALECQPEDLLPDPDHPAKPQPCPDCGGVYAHDSGCQYAT